MGLNRPHNIARHVALGALATTALSSAWAGPRVGEALGQPSTISSTVQATVVSATPIVGQVPVSRQTCFDEMRQEPPRSSGAGALLGAIAGGAMGNAVGKGGGRALATGLGVIGGAIVGDHIQNDGRPGTTRTVRRCEQQPAFENRVVAYNVVYEYAGQRHSTQMTREPGRTIPVQVTLSPVLSDEDRYVGTDDEARGDDWEEDEAPVVYEELPQRPRHHRRGWY